MLWIERLEIEDFGPFKHRQAVEFPADAGVTIVYGENMRGKTSLLNAIRFAFFGNVLSRSRKAGSLAVMGNWERAAEGCYGFQVVLRFRSDNVGYELTRACRPRPNVGVPRSDQDYSVTSYLQRDGVVLGPDQAEHELARLLPQQVSRFFLFDAELLQEYEDLLRNDSDMGHQISEAIERILGVPVLTGARATLARLRDEFDKREAKAAQADQMTRELGQELERLQEARRIVQDELNTSRETIERLKTEKNALDEELRRAERLTALMSKRDGLEKQIGDIERRIEEHGAAVKDAMRKAWRPLLAARLRETVRLLAEEERELQTRRMRNEVMKLPLGTDAACPACLQPVSDEVRAHLQTLAETTAATVMSDEARLREVQQRLAVLIEVAADSDTKLLHALWANLHAAERERYTKADELLELSRKLEDVDEVRLRRTHTDHERTIKLIGVEEEGQKTLVRKVEEHDQNIDRVRRKLEMQGGADLDRLRLQRARCVRLHDLFDFGVAAYRERLRTRVEADATALFRRLITEPDYAGLRINDNYGLTIVHESGADIPVRSAGAEHVVALSLVGALQRNAPLRGPIIIDSPFGRLDRSHTKNVVEALPSMSDQVCLLVYEEELAPSLAREMLKGRLRREYRLERVSARYTRIERVVEG
jgi:DNA sulfur modification protein DndD